MAQPTGYYQPTLANPQSIFNPDGSINLAALQNLPLNELETLGSGSYLDPVSGNHIIPTYDYQTSTSYNENGTPDSPVTPQTPSGYMTVQNQGQVGRAVYSRAPYQSYDSSGRPTGTGGNLRQMDDATPGRDALMAMAILASVGGAGAALAAGGAGAAGGGAAAAGAGAPATFGTTGAIGGHAAATGMGTGFTTLGAGGGLLGGASPYAGLSESGLAGEGAFTGTNAAGGAATGSGAGGSTLLGTGAAAPATFGTTDAIGGYAGATGMGADFVPLAGAAGAAGISIPGSQLTGAASGLGSLLGPAATALGGIAGAQGTENENSSVRRMDPRLDDAVYGANGIVPRTQGLLAQQTSPENQERWRQVEARGFGLLGTPQRGNGFDQFANRRLM